MDRSRQLFSTPVNDDALVIGAGVVGVCTAYALARRGLSVTIVERCGEAGRGTSFANGAQLSYSYTEALASPGLLKRLPWILAAADPAFRVRPSVDPDFLKWSLAFVRNCTGARFTQNSLAGLRLGMSSRLALGQLLAQHPLEFGHEAPGKLLLYESSESLRAAAALADAKVAAGADQRVVTPREAVAIEPTLGSVAPRLAGAVWLPGEEVGDPYRFCGALLALLKDSFGVRVRFGATIERLAPGPPPTVSLASGERLGARHIVLCAGPQAPELLRTIGIRVPIVPVRGHSITAPLGPAAPRVSTTDTARKLVFCRLSGRMRVAGQADVGMHRSGVAADRLRALVRSARESLPNAARYDRLDSSWAGLRPVTPNSLPIIKRIGQITLNVGHGALGWTYAMGAAEQAARLVLGEAA